jgi:hypothetical protein
MKKLNLKQHDSCPAKFNEKVITNLITNRTCKLTSVFKENMISDYIEEFLKRFYSLSESLERLPRIANYYRNYSNFFCRPRFGDLQINVLLESNGDIKAELYYKQNYAKKHESFEKVETLLTTTVKQDIEENILTVRRSESILGTSVSYLNEQGIINSSGLLTAKQSKNTSLIGLLFSLEGKAEKPDKAKKNKYNISTFDRTKAECQSSKNSEAGGFKELKEKVDNIEKIEKIVIANKAASNAKLGFEGKSRNQRKSLDNKNSSIVRTNVSTAKKVNVMKTGTVTLYPKYSFQTVILDSKNKRAGVGGGLNGISGMSGLTGMKSIKNLNSITSTTSKPKIILTKPNIDKLTKQISRIGKDQINKLIKKDNSKIQYSSIDRLEKVDAVKSISRDKNEFMTLNLTPSQQSKDIKIINCYKNIQSSRSTNINIKKTYKPEMVKKPSVDFRVKDMVEGSNFKKYINNPSRNVVKRLDHSKSKGECSLENRIFNTYNYINSVGKGNMLNIERAKTLISNKITKQTPKKK